MREEDRWRKSEQERGSSFGMDTYGSICMNTVAWYCESSRAKSMSELNQYLVPCVPHCSPALGFTFPALTSPGLSHVGQYTPTSHGRAVNLLTCPCFSKKEEEKNIPRGINKDKRNKSSMQVLRVSKKGGYRGVFQLWCQVLVSTDSLLVLKTCGFDLV